MPDNQLSRVLIGVGVAACLKSLALVAWMKEIVYTAARGVCYGVVT